MVIVGLDKAEFILVQDTFAQPTGDGLDAHEDEDAGHRQVGLLAGFDVFQASPGDVLVAFDLRNHGVPDDFDLVVGKDLFLVELGAPELVPAVDDVDFLGKPGQEDGVLEGGVAAAHHGDGLIPVQGAVTGGAVAHAFAGEFRFSGEPGPPGLGAAGDDNGAADDFFSPFQNHGMMRLAGFEPGDLGAPDFRAEAFSLVAHPLGKFETGNTLRESRGNCPHGRWS